MKKPNGKTDKPKVHPELKGFDIYINELGEVKWSKSIEEVNLFLNKHVVDKKLKERFGYKSDEEDDTIHFMY
ncbi:hypothetical protein AAG747_10250 [Rapidithrix thailandica]|uniref:Uncharacterized protein n=1 Tax=Rapidithrix thailandica TaxID=413964 RepID=A0AAW9S5S1_9BACT